MVETPLLTVEDVMADPQIRRRAHLATIERCWADPTEKAGYDADETTGFRYFACDIMRFDGTRGLSRKQIAGRLLWESKNPGLRSMVRSPEPDYTHAAYDEMFFELDLALAALDRAIQSNSESEALFHDLLLLACRYSGKSTAIGLLVLYMGLRWKNIAILLLAETETIGIDFVTKWVRPWMCGQSGAYLEEVFGPEGYLVPEKEWGRWGKGTELNFPRRVEGSRRDPTILIRGANQDFTGKHPDVVIGEDLVNLATTETMGSIQTVKKTWNATSYLWPKLRIDVGTIWVETDLHNERLKEARKKAAEGSGTVRFLHLPARVARKTVVVKGGVETVVEEYDDTCPPRFPHLTDARLKALRASDDMGDALYPGQMDLNPLPAGYMLFTLEMFGGDRIWKAEDVFRTTVEDGSTRKVVRPDLTMYGYVDLAGSTGASKDQSALLVVGIDPRGHVYVIEAVTGRFMPEENLSKMATWQKQYHLLHWGVEGGVLRTVYEPLARDWNRKRPTEPIYLRKVESGGARGGTNDRALRIRPPAMRGEIHLGREQTWLLEQLLRYSAKDNTVDDGVAALSLVCINKHSWGRAESPPPKPEPGVNSCARVMAHYRKRRSVLAGVGDGL